MRLPSFKSKQSIVELVAECKWKKLKNKIRCFKTDEEAFVEVKCNSACTNPHHSLLHFACRFRPPLYILKELVRFSKESISTRDCLGRFPIHIAANNGIEPGCLEYMIECDKEAANAQDVYGRTPFHYIFLNFSSKSQPGIEFGGAIFRDAIKDNVRNVARILYRASPQSLLIDDFMGKNVLEIAIEEEVEYALLRELQIATKKARDPKSKKRIDNVRTTQDLNKPMTKDLRYSLPSVPNKYLCPNNVSKRYSRISISRAA